MAKQEAGGEYLVGKLLLAMPSMGDTRFERAVILICAHDENGAMGLVVNHKLADIQASDMLEQLGLTSDINIDLSRLQIMSGGPVDGTRGFLLHSQDFQQKDTISVDSNYHVTGTLDALKAVVEGNGPDKMLFILGYAGWGGGQLESELQSNSWLVVDPQPELVFDVPIDQKWARGIESLGINPAMLSGSAGRA